MLDLVAFDQTVLSALTSPSLSALQPFFFVVTELGSSLALLIYSAIAISIGNKDIKKVAAIMAIALLLGILVTEDLKDLVQRPRPYEGFAPTYLFSNANSFPSGHSLCAFAAASVLLCYLGWKFGLVGYTAAALIGISRVALNVHYPTDVLGGAIIGIVVGELVIFAAYRLGLSKNPGIFSIFMRSANDNKNIGDADKKPLIGINCYYVLIAAALVLIIVFYDLAHMSLSLAMMAVASILTALAMSSMNKVRAPLLIVMMITMIGLLAAFSALMIGGFIVSLAILAITYLAILWTTIKKTTDIRSKENF